jgi:transcriptional regulator with XRE-family HTH domain
MATWIEYMNRLARGVTAKAIAARVGVDSSQVSRWRSGQLPTAENAIRFAEEFNGDPVEALIAAGHAGEATALKPRSERPASRPGSAGAAINEPPVMNFWANNPAYVELGELRALSPGTVGMLLMTARAAHDLSNAVSEQAAEVKDLIEAAHAVARAAESAAIESFGGVYEFLRSMPALKAYIEKEALNSPKRPPAMTAEEVAASLVRHYAEMYRRAITQGAHLTSDEQVREQLREDVDPNSVIEPEIGDDRYVRYLEVRLSAREEDGDPGFQEAMWIDSLEYMAAHVRFRREFTEMMTFGGRIRTAGAPALDEYRTNGPAFTDPPQSDASGEADEADEAEEKKASLDEPQGWGGLDPDALEAEADRREHGDQGKKLG